MVDIGPGTGTDSPSQTRQVEAVMAKANRSRTAVTNLSRSLLRMRGIDIVAASVARVVDGPGADDANSAGSEHARCQRAQCLPPGAEKRSAQPPRHLPARRSRADPRGTGGTAKSGDLCSSAAGRLLVVGTDHGLESSSRGDRSQETPPMSPREPTPRRWPRGLAGFGPDTPSRVGLCGERAVMRRHRRA